MRPPAYILLLASLVLLHPAHGQDSQPQTTTSTVPEPPDEAIGFETPRSTMRGFLWAGRDDDWDTAATHLDLRSRRPDEGRRLARELKTILDRKLWVDLDALSNAPEGESGDSQTRDRDHVGTIDPGDGGEKVKILVERVPGPEGRREWKIARVTVQQTERLWRAFGDGPLAERLPDPFFEIRFLDVQLWQWIALALLLLASLALAWLLTALLLRLARAITRRTGAPIDEVLTELIVGPIRLAVGTAVFSGGLYAVWLPLRAHRFVTGLCTGLLWPPAGSRGRREKR